jgi:hypothetical protein
VKIDALITEGQKSALVEAVVQLGIGRSAVQETVRFWDVEE